MSAIVSSMTMFTACLTDHDCSHVNIKMVTQDNSSSALRLCLEKAFQFILFAKISIENFCTLTLMSVLTFSFPFNFAQWGCLAISESLERNVKRTKYFPIREIF